MLCFVVYFDQGLGTAHAGQNMPFQHIFYAKKLKKLRKSKKNEANLKQNYAEIKFLSLHPNVSEGFIPRKPSTSIWVKHKIHIFGNFASIFLLFTLFLLLAQNMLKKQISILFGVRSTQTMINIYNNASLCLTII